MVTVMSWQLAQEISTNLSLSINWTTCTDQNDTKRNLKYSECHVLRNHTITYITAHVRTNHMTNTKYYSNNEIPIAPNISSEHCILNDGNLYCD